MHETLTGGELTYTQQQRLVPRLYFAYVFMMGCRTGRFFFRRVTSPACGRTWVVVLVVHQTSFKTRCCCCCCYSSGGFEVVVYMRFVAFRCSCSRSWATSWRFFWTSRLTVSFVSASLSFRVYIFHSIYIFLVLALVFVSFSGTYNRDDRKRKRLFVLVFLRVPTGTYPSQIGSVPKQLYEEI